jgi:hypothetical protein
VIVVLLVAVATIATFGQQKRPVTLLVPPFEGPASLGTNVATILNLQVWQTLRKAPFPNPSGLSFGDGLVTWPDRPLSSQTHEEALRAAQENDADLVLWGKAIRYGTGVVVQAHLTIRRTARQSIWRVNMPGRGDGSPLEVDLPRLRYEFRPIVLAASLVEIYSTPDALSLYKSPTAREPIGTVGPYFIALQHNGAATLVQSGDVTGWIRLPALSNSRTELVDFAGGIIRIMRADWGGARDLFAKVISNQQTPTALRMDAHLYRAVAVERSGSSGEEDVRLAYAINPYDRATVSYRVMSQFASVARMPTNDPGRERALTEARRLLDSNRFLFPAGDPWFTRASAALKSNR